MPRYRSARHIFQAPTLYYKTGVVFMAYLNGHQIIFAWSADRKARASTSFIWLTSFDSPTGQGLLKDPERSVARMLSAR